MLSKSIIKYIRSLELKKFRQRENAFVAEGPKVVGELLGIFTPKLIVATPEWLCQHGHAVHADVYEVTDEELRKASFLQHPQSVLAVFALPEAHRQLPATVGEQLFLALDNVQDPGNLGTIIRIADWFGIRHIVCNVATADAYSPKVVQATMGSLARVSLYYTPLVAWLDALPAGTPVYGTLLDGSNIYEKELTAHGVIVMGNEGNGISDEVRQRLSCRILIPNYPEGSTSAESLNVAIATAVTCAEFRRQTSGR
ncbi:MAG: RNA methyltransferase [Prevotella sp.]|nr:RNA methyltransferase [Prevotella sp.]